MAWQCGAFRSRGEATLSAQGLEGGGLYALTPALRRGAPLTVDLVPDKTGAALTAALAQKPDKLRLAHWLRNTLRLPPAKVALFFEMTAGQTIPRTRWVEMVKCLPLRHDGLRPIDEAISTAGGLRFDALTDDLMLKSHPGVFCAGEMLDWEAPTGGYLITACLATGRWAGQGAARYLAAAA
jgi:predicted flavoprotein YhiN